jgi:hypothetical protein
MEQNNKKENSMFEIPPVQSVEVPLVESESSNDQKDKLKHSSEQSSANIYSGANPQPLAQDSSMILPIVNDSTVTDTTSLNGATQISVTDGIIASDKDLIEKIWVDKAKAIIEESQGDPHKKNANLAMVKNQYKSARFNKLISDH